MKRGIVVIAVASLLAAPANGQEMRAALNPVHWSAEAAVAHGLHIGSRFAVLLRARIDEGWHLYALPEKDAFPLATEVAIATNPSIDLLHVEEERPHKSMDEESHVVTGWFARSTTFTLRMAVTRTMPHDLEVLVRYQACNERMCLPARQVTVPVPLTNGR